MFAESGRTHESLRRMTAAFERWLSPRLEAGSYFGWMLEDAGVVIAGLGMMVIDWPPHPSHPADEPDPSIPCARAMGIAALHPSHTLIDRLSRGQNASALNHGTPADEGTF
ncbi:hypothetical protein [Bradyrhizobium sp. RDI18]|uniref:hypothetical protein n=1 Tax=Bradyrhizobium sp. RDI18 TaxID=3367400 RepID=UPI00371F875E